jgi:tripartite-type tricarboxylate transporter receptor subunit TctC
MLPASRLEDCMRRLLLTLLLTCSLPAAAVAEYPDRPIRLIVPQAAGSATDTAARLLAATLGPELGQQVVVEDRPGAALTLGLDLVAKSPADGYTLGMGPIGALAITRHMVKRLPYDIERDFQPIAMVTRGQMVLAVSPQLPVNSVADLIADAKAHPGKLSNASSSNGSPGHVGGELFKYMTGTEIVHVPYRGGALAIQDLMAGRVDVMFESLESTAPFVHSGKIHVLAVTASHRSPAFPELPTVAEAGVPGYDAPTWTGLVAPAGVSREIVDKLNAAVNRAVRAPTFVEAFARTGNEPGGGTPEEFAATIAADSAKWGAVIARAGITFE